MVRSILLNGNDDDYNVTVGIDGGTEYIAVAVDGATDNASFTATSYDIGGWFTFSIERMNNNIYLKIIIQKNLSTQERHGSIIIQHNSSKISKYITISQKAVEYEINVAEHYYAFNSIPPIDNNVYASYEEKRINISASNGRGKWRVKEIKQYQTSTLDTFTDEIYSGSTLQDDEMIQTRTTYDGVFNYYIDGNDLVVRSYGQTDLTPDNSHMRYFFVITHSDIDNENRLYLDELDDYQEETKKYEDKILFVFDNTNGNGGGYGEDYSPAIPDVSPSDTENVKNYIFTINGSKKHISNIISNGGSLDIEIVSTCNGKTIGYTYEIKNGTTADGTQWVTYYEDTNKWEIKANDTYSDRSCKITFKQKESGNLVYETISQAAMSKSYTFQIVIDGVAEPYTEDFDWKLEKNESEIILEVVSTYANSNTPYSMIGVDNYNWITSTKDGSKYKINFTENDDQTERSVTIIFTQTNSMKKIYMNISQEQAEDKIVFEAYFTEDSSLEKTIEHEYQEVSVSVVSTLNGVYADYDCDPDSTWVTYNKSNNILYVDQYSFDDGTTDERSCNITFTRDGIDTPIILKLTQKRQPMEVHFECTDNITVGYEGKEYLGQFTIYSYGTADGLNHLIEITKWEIIEGDNFVTDINYLDYKQDYNGYYYEPVITVTTNELEDVRNCKIQFTNASGKTCTLAVEQRKNGEVILTSFDYIVMNYNWTDEVTSSGTVLSKDFDCIMYFDTQSIGDMYQKCAYFSSKTISVTGEDGATKVYGELAYDQVSSTTDDLNRIETQVVYLLKLQEDGYLQKIKEASEKYLTIQLYGNFYRPSAVASSSSKKTTLSIHTYLGGTMEKDDTNKTMKNVDGEEKNVGVIKDVTYEITSAKASAGSSVTVLEENGFQHLGTISYNIRDKSAVFTPINAI